MKLADAPPRRLSTLLAWLEAHGATFDRCRPREIAGQGLGLEATTDVDAGDQLLLIPPEVWLSPKTRHTRHGDLLRYAAGEELVSGSMEELALLVALERADPTSFFASYLDALVAPTTPFGLDADTVEALQSPEMEAWLEAQDEESQAQHRALRDRLSRRFPDAYPWEEFALDRWRWAYGHVLQRCFTADIEDEEVWVMIPGMDLCNHDGSMENAYYSESEGWLFEAPRSWREGEQVLINYGEDKSSVDFFLYYGFVPPDNPNDRIRLELGVEEGDPDEDAKLERLERAGLENECTVGIDGLLPRSFVEAASLWTLPPDRARNGHGLGDPRHEADVFDGLADGIRAELADLPTSIAEDAALFVTSGEDAPPTPVIAYRLAFKKVMDAAARAFRRRASRLRRGLAVPGHLDEVAAGADDDDDVYEMASVIV